LSSVLPGPILITGASGFVGRHAVPGLLDRGLQVHALVRSAEKGRPLERLGARVFVGDLLAPDSLRSALDGCTAALHLAGLGYSSDSEANHRVNVIGSRHLAEAAQDQGVSRIINVSSTCAGRELRDSYGISKARAEQEFQLAGLQVTHLRPTMIYGKGSEEFLKFSETIRRSPLVPIPGDGHFQLQPVNIEDTVELFFRIFESEQPPSGTYDVAGPAPISINQLIKEVAQAQGTRARPLHVPASLALLGARLLGRLMEHPPANIDQVMAFLQHTRVNIEPTMRDFAWQPRALPDGLRETFGAGP
tara:strand:- start:4530 stop:5444 length:915 start_codon:yes stop_codon:yes gene_type:complete